MDIILGLAGIALGFASAWALLSTKAIKLTSKLEDMQTELNIVQISRTEYSERAIIAETKLEDFSRRLREKQQEMDTLQERSKADFRNTATTIFEGFNEKFAKQSEEKIGNLLNPLRERITDFQKLVTDSFKVQGQEQHTLKAEIEKIVLQTDGLTKALRGDVKAQGNWGEVILERILEESGLRRDEEYTIQGEGLKLTNDEGGRQQPDVIVNLPDDKHIIIDSKVSLTAYDRYCSTADEQARTLLVKEFIRSIKAHVNGLESKRYQDNEKLRTPDFVMLFMPIEGAFSLAMQNDSELHSYAWGKKIVLVCPSTLFATLKTVASLWRIERQNKNSQKIAEQAAKIYDKFHGFIGDMDNIGTHLERAQKVYEAANNKLRTGKGNLLNLSEKLIDYGVKPTKAFPKTATEKTDDDETDEKNTA